MTLADLGHTAAFCAALLLIYATVWLIAWIVNK